MATQMITNPPVLDSTGQLIVTALQNLAEATQPTNVYVDIPMSIPVDGWTDTEPPTYVWMNQNITGECGIEVAFADGAEDVAMTFIRVTKIVGGLRFTIDEVPEDAIPLIVRVINAKADSFIGDIDATMVETSAVAGVTNVEEALTDLDGRIDDNADDIAANSDAIAKLNSNGNITNDILADAISCTRTSFFAGGGASYTGSIPYNNYKYGTFYVYPRYSTKMVIAQSPYNEIATNVYDEGSWTGWQELATKNVTDLGTDTIANLQAKMVTLFYSAVEGFPSYFKMTVSVASSVFENTFYDGELIKMSSTRFNVYLHRSGSIVEIVGTYSSGTWSWAKLATKSDITGSWVELTSSASASVTIKPTDNYGSSGYVIRGGFCYVSLWITLSANTGDSSVAVVSNLPAPMKTSFKPPSWSSFAANNKHAESLLQNTILYIRNATAGDWSISFSYPVLNP